MFGAILPRSLPGTLVGWLQYQDRQGGPDVVWLSWHW